MQFNVENSKVPRCQHVKADGIQCNNPALKTQRYCYYHAQLQRTLGKPHAPAATITIESIAAVRLALTDVLNRISRSAIDPRDARLMIRGLHNATLLLKLDALARDDEHREQPTPITDPSNLEPHVVVLSREDEKRLQGISGKGVFRMMTMAAKAAREKAEAEYTSNHHDTSDFGPSPYTMLPHEYEDDVTPPPPVDPDADIHDLPLDQLDTDEQQREIARRKQLIRDTLPPLPDDAPVRCLLVDQPTCQYTTQLIDERIFTCPVTEAAAQFKPRLLPDLEPHLDDSTRCWELHEYAKELAEYDQPLKAGLRDKYGRFVADYDPIRPADLNKSPE